MKQLFLAVLALMLTACSTREEGPVETKTVTWGDSCQYANVKVKAEVPTGSDAVSTAIRDTLLWAVYQELSTIGCEDGQHIMPPYSGADPSPRTVIAHYGKAVYDEFCKLCKNDVADRMSYLEEDSTMTDEIRQEAMTDTPQWAGDLLMTKTYETATVVVFYMSDYIYLGGAHGGVSGAGSMTFDRKTGQPFHNFLKPGSLQSLQPLLAEGLLSYFHDSGENYTMDEMAQFLFLADLEHVNPRHITDVEIPLPAYEPQPGPDGLTFTYQQYEIACYAAGMPAFTIAYDQIAPYLTDEAKALLGVK